MLKIHFAATKEKKMLNVNEDLNHRRDQPSSFSKEMEPLMAIIADLRYTLLNRQDNVNVSRSHGLVVSIAAW